MATSNGVEGENVDENTVTKDLNGSLEAQTPSATLASSLPQSQENGITSGSDTMNGKQNTSVTSHKEPRSEGTLDRKSRIRVCVKYL